MIPLRDDVPSRTFPAITVALIALNSAAFLFELSLGRALGEFFLRFGLVPAVLRVPEAGPMDMALPFFTSMFLHGGWMHILSNVWTLWIFGDNVEDRLGKARYVLLYLASGLAAGALQVVTHWGSTVPVIGASGAIAGVLGAYFLLFPKAKVLTLVPFFGFMRLMELPAAVYLGIWFLTQLYHGVAGLGARFGGIAWWAHIGGFLAGLALVKALGPRRRSLSNLPYD